MSLVSVLIGDGCGVMLADSQETISGYAKRSVDKISYRGIPGPAEVQYAIGGASDSGPYLDSFNLALEGALLHLTCPNVHEARDLIEDAALEFHMRHIWPQGKEHPRLETLILIQGTIPSADGKAPTPLIIHVDQTAVNVQWSGSKSVGIGSYLADYLADTLMQNTETESHLLAAAVYILKQVKEHVDGVGLDGKLVIFGSEINQQREYIQADISALEEIMRDFDAVIGLTFGNMMEQIGEERLASIVGEMKSLKDRYAQAITDIPARQKQRLKQLMDQRQRLG